MPTAPTMEGWTVRTLGAAFWHAEPTSNSDVKAQQLASALGYPSGWRVVRDVVVDDDDEEEEQKDDTSEDPEEETSKQPRRSSSNQLIVDRIYTNHPNKTDCAVWYHHGAAMQAAARWYEAEAAAEAEQEGSAPTKKKKVMNLEKQLNLDGGHMLPRQASYEKGDLVEAFFDGKWWEARIVRRNKEHPVYGWRYQVHYDVDNSKQSGVPEENLRPRPWSSTGGDKSAKKRKKQDEDDNDNTDVDPHVLAVHLGLDESWSAVSNGHKRYKITSPGGTVYHSKAKALEAFTSGTAATSRTDEGDPPWRTVGHELLGQLVCRQVEQAVTSRRSVTVVQYGYVTGWIAATDVDQAGQPGYRSETTGQPAALFHIEYTPDPLHPYPSYTIDNQDLEYEEVVSMLVETTTNSAATAATK